MIALCSGQSDEYERSQEHVSTESRQRTGGKPLARKIVVVGDGNTGKTSLLHVFTRGNFPQVYEPTVFESSVVDVEVDDQAIELSLWDTAGQEDFGKLRNLSYVDSHVILLCFSVDQRASLDNIESKWMDEILAFCPGVKLCLIANKCDLRDDPRTREKLARYCTSPVDYEEGLLVARRIRASRYLECSANMDRGVQELFEEASRVAIGARARGQTQGSRNTPRADRNGRQQESGCNVS